MGKVAERASRNLRHQRLFPGVFLRGMLMGAADVVPGVSGGTVAFVTGIYQRLVTALSAFDLTLLRRCLRGDWRGAWDMVDGGFLFTLVSGIALSVFSLARVISHLLDTQALLLWSFFFGLILASSLMLMRHVSRWTPVTVVGAVLGAVVAIALGFSPMLALPASLSSFFFAGFVAICAMILPGISGSFILVLLGMYPRVLGAVETLDVAALGVFCAGAASGLLTFSRLLSYFLRVHHGSTLATLTGVLMGSLIVVWPWQISSDDGVSRVFPGAYAQSVGDSQLGLCLALMALGLGAVWLLESRWGGVES